jgi:hypothetical protein
MLGSLSLLCIYMLAINEPKSNLDFYEYNNNEWLTPSQNCLFSLPFRGDDVLLKAIISLDLAQASRPSQRRGRSDLYSTNYEQKKSPWDVQ